MTTDVIHDRSPVANPIPLLDASYLPSADDWALLEAIQLDADIAGDAEPDFDRYGRLRVSASFDE